jgi:aspartyl-tRNA(Asn)/glutamyl-tRNA(Gln) amidotransferase subunit B
VLVGLEIHVQLATKTKMFSSVANGATNFGAEPNSLVDEVILGLPGVLPVMNKKAVEYSIMVGLALGCEIAKHTKWDRKSYYYPDLPKNYQISQYDLPLCYEGVFEIAAEDGSRAFGGRISRRTPASCCTMRRAGSRSTTASST